MCKLKLKPTAAKLTICPLLSKLLIEMYRVSDWEGDEHKDRVKKDRYSL